MVCGLFFFSIFTVVQPSLHSALEHFHHPKRKHVHCISSLSPFPYLLHSIMAAAADILIYTGIKNTSSEGKFTFYILLAEVQKKGLHPHRLPYTHSYNSTHMLRHTSIKTHIRTHRDSHSFSLTQRFIHKFMYTYSQLHACRHTHPENNFPNSSHSNDSS